MGSPPQVRGKPFLQCKVFLQYRITPAGAGKTACVDYSHCILQDHPRRCGENMKNPLDCQTSMGSPPQVRGKQPAPCRRGLHQGITPAGAGKTFPTPYFLRQLKDHPRRCGENRSALSGHWHGGGSPPQVRGKHVLDILFRQESGITPAGAGKTSLKYCRWKEEQDHPRRCGENR